MCFIAAKWTTRYLFGRNAQKYPLALNMPQITYLSTIILSKTEIDFAKHIAVLHKIDSPSYVDALKIAKRHIMMTITCITKMNCEYMSVGVLMRYLKGKNN